ncbi:hypothetical protein, partial [Flavobacterium beibuense]|uniref:hypothetical protein n=1 Tax=Flavobacterium beibuense TaxID=657326 RepID=UPI0013EB2B0F
MVPPSQEDLTVCDPDSDGHAQFDLDALVGDMINNGENLSVTFHETAIDAEEGINAIPNTNNYTNTNAYNQTLYVRVENTVTGCYTATAYALNLIVVDTPQIDADLQDITLCDTDNNDQDALAAVDLTVQDSYILEHLGNADP